MTPKGIRAAIIVCFISLLLFATVWYYTGLFVALVIWIGSFVAVVSIMSTDKSAQEPPDVRSGRF